MLATLIAKLTAKTQCPGKPFFGYQVMWTNVPEQEEIMYYISKRRQTIYVNKGAREDARVVSLS